MWCGWSYRLTGRWDRQRRTERCCFFICCLPALSSRCTSNTLNLLQRHYTPGLLLVELYSELRGGLCVSVRVRLRAVLMRKTFLGIQFVCGGFCSLHLHFCAFFVFALACESKNALDLNGSFHFMFTGLHSCFRKLFRQLACNGPPLCMCVYLCVLPVFDYCVCRVVSGCASALC